MGRHDSIFKRLLREFFSDLLWLAVPELAGRLDLTRPVLLDKELFTAGGRRREVDLLARVSFLAVEGGGALLVHVEVEARARPGMERRLWLYRNQIQAAHESHVLSIVLYNGDPVASKGRPWARTSSATWRTSITSLSASRTAIRPRTWTGPSLSPGGWPRSCGEAISPDRHSS
jgi:hypothetical protein